MPDDLTRLVAVIEGEGPSPDFVAALRIKIEAELRDEQSPAHLGPDKGDLIMVDIQSKTGTSRESDETRRSWRRYAVLAAAAAVVVVIAAVALFDGTEDSSLDFVDAPFTESHALGIVEVYYSAVEAGDADAIAATLAEDMIRAGAADLGEVLALLVWDAAQGTDLVDRTCSAGNEESGTFVVVCEFGNYQYLQRVAGAPATPIIETITVTADGVTTTGPLLRQATIPGQRCLQLLDARELPRGRIRGRLLRRGWIDRRGPRRRGAAPPVRRSVGGPTSKIAIAPTRSGSGVDRQAVWCFSPFINPMSWGGTPVIQMSSRRST